jgi:hypothetical protein
MTTTAIPGLHRLTATLCLLAIAPAAPAWSLPPAEIPEGARASIAAVHAAAVAKDFNALRAQMDASGFVSSFGGEGSVDEALDLWRKDPELLAELARATAQACALEENYVECPAGAGTGYRAGFGLTDEGWRMQWFLAGD